MTRPLNVVSPDAVNFFFGAAPRCVTMRRAGTLAELRDVLHAWAAEPPPAPTTLDLLGHSTRDHHLLRLGDTPIDMLNPPITRYFRRLAASGVLDRLNIAAVRLLGCETAVTDTGRRTVRMLARTLDRPVFGTLAPLLKSHSNADGFHPAYSHLLTEAQEIPI